MPGENSFLEMVESVASYLVGVNAVPAGLVVRVAIPARVAGREPRLRFDAPDLAGAAEPTAVAWALQGPLSRPVVGAVALLAAEPIEPGFPR